MPEFIVDTFDTATYPAVVTIGYTDMSFDLLATLTAAGDPDAAVELATRTKETS